jgi:hypothetical protein
VYQGFLYATWVRALRHGLRFILVAGAVGGASASVEDDHAAARDAAKAANATLAGQWGQWFDFNDSNVSPMGVTSLQKAFQGVCCVRQGVACWACWVTTFFVVG